MKTKIKIFSLLSLLIALLMLLASMTTLGVALRAHASNISQEEMENYVFPEHIPDEDYSANPDENLTSLHYFSDYDKSQEYFKTGFIRQYINCNNNLQNNGEDNAYLYYEEAQGFWKSIMTYTVALEFQKIQNAFVIFEVRFGFPKTILLSEEESEAFQELSPYTLLYDAFKVLKENGCKIMFICGTEEVRYQNYNSETGKNYSAFLDYVDIHIDVDFSTTYRYSVIKKMEHITRETAWAETTIILDVSMGDSWEFFKEFMIYFVYQYQLQVGTPEQILEEKRVNVLFYRPDEKVYYTCSGSLVDTELAKTLWIESYYGFIIGGVGASKDENLQSLLKMRVERTELYEFGYTNINADYYIMVIMRDFILNDYESLKQYINYKGRCKITFKPIFYSPYGWLLLPDYEVWLDAILEYYREFDFLEQPNEFLDFIYSDTPPFAQWS